MSGRNCRFDLILLYTQFRVHNYYLNLVKYLSRECSVGIYEIARPEDDKAKRKVLETDRIFLSLCQELGATILEPSESYSCRLLLAPQHGYSGNEAHHIQSSKILALQRFGSGSLGLTKLRDMGATGLLVYDRQLFLDKLASEGKDSLADYFDIMEMGTPYARYPVFDSQCVPVDYLIAYPSPMFLRDSGTRFRLFADFNKLVDSIPQGMTTYLKLHNVQDGGYVFGSSRFLKQLGTNFNAFSHIATSALLKRLPLSIVPSSGRNTLYSLAATILCSSLEARVPILSALTECHNFGIEHFIPFVKKGVITGLSSCIWHSLYQRVPVFNCDGQPLVETMPNYAIYKNFHVPPCHGKLVFDPSLFDQVSPSARNADLVALIKKEM